MSGEKEDLSKVSTWSLLNDFVWGDEPDNIDEIRAELERRGVNTRKLAEQIDNVINRWDKEQGGGGDA